jgi:hypothetical protein
MAVAKVSDFTSDAELISNRISKAVAIAIIKSIDSIPKTGSYALTAVTDDLKKQKQDNWLIWILNYVAPSTIVKSALDTLQTNFGDQIDNTLDDLEHQTNQIFKLVRRDARDTMRDVNRNLYFLGISLTALIGSAITILIRMGFLAVSRDKKKFEKLEDKSSREQKEQGLIPYNSASGKKKSRKRGRKGSKQETRKKRKKRKQTRNK